MARSDLILKLIRAGRSGDQNLLRQVTEALIAEERARKHTVLADQLEESLRRDASPMPNGASPTQSIEGLLFEVSPRRRLDDVILSPAVAEICSDLVEEHARADLLRSHNLEPRHRILLMGPPGNGKTILAEALAHELLLPLFTVRYEGVIASFLGETAARVGRLFEFVRSRQCVLFFDEFDAVAKERGDPHDTGEVKRVVSSLLLQIDGLPSHVVVVTASNHPELLDRAVWRRFQVRVSLDKPNAAQRLDYLSRLLANVEGIPPSRVEPLSRRLTGASFADIEEFTETIKRKAVLKGPGAEIGPLVTKSLREWKERAKARTNADS